ncbi:conserved hypothetical protein [Shewanella denitrificans OS217]|jgi:hypothetical protein|uniref:WbqC-like protein n=2 Tax=Shewanella TaxID=22 RepID=Q12PP7_SHEDO|nr:conserved hypothetical protein [Shewanella denitrificans OS217]
MQPTYLPWMGYFDLIDIADKFVFLDNVQLERSGWQVRNRIRSSQGELMLRVAIATPKRFDETLIHQTQFVTGHPWRKKHLKSIQMNYQKAPYFAQVYPLLESLYQKDETSLSQFNISVINALCTFMGINTPRMLASELVDIEGIKDARLTSICKHLDADQYLSPLGAMAYIEQESSGGDLGENGIDVFYHQFVHPQYTQVYDGFISHLSIIDALFNLGPQNTVTLIRQFRQAPINYTSLPR